MNDRLKELLMRSFDSELTPEEERELTEALEGAPELREERARHAKLRAALAKGPDGGFGPLFVQRVMERIEAVDLAALGALDKAAMTFGQMFRRVALIGAAAMLVLMVVNLSFSECFSLAGAFGLCDEFDNGILSSPVYLLFGEAL